MLVILCALLAIAAFGLWKLCSSSTTLSRVCHTPHRYFAGPADKQRAKALLHPYKAPEGVKHILEVVECRGLDFCRLFWPARVSKITR
jgi:hypothetical protein